MRNLTFFSYYAVFFLVIIVCVVNLFDCTSYLGTCIYTTMIVFSIIFLYFGYNIHKNLV
jgi:hypothetical protein